MEYASRMTWLGDHAALLRLAESGYVGSPNQSEQRSTVTLPKSTRLHHHLFCGRKPGSRNRGPTHLSFISKPRSTDLTVSSVSLFFV